MVIEINSSFSSLSQRLLPVCRRGREPLQASHGWVFRAGLIFFNFPSL